MPLFGFLIEDLADHLRKEGRMTDEQHAAFVRKLRFERRLIIGLMLGFSAVMWWIVLT